MFRAERRSHGDNVGMFEKEELVGNLPPLALQDQILLERQSLLEWHSSQAAYHEARGVPVFRHPPGSSP